MQLSRNVALLISTVYAQNVAMNDKNLMVSVDAGPLITRQLPSGNDVSVELPDGITGFHDILFDKTNQNLLFALSTTSQRVCSYLISQKDLALGNCVGSNIPVSPFSGIAAFGGHLVVSGGTGGLSVFSYDQTTGILLSNPLVDGLRLNVVGLPDVTMISDTEIAFSADLGDSPRFGTLIASITASNSVETVGEFRIQGSGFNNAIGPANFAFVNAILSNSKGTYLYTAHGIMTVVDPSKTDETVIPIDGAPSGFEAVTVAVNPTGTRVYFGGLVNENSIFLEYDTTNPVSPVLVGSEKLDGRITSIAASDNFIATANDQNVITSFEAGKERQPVEPSTSPITTISITTLGLCLFIHSSL